MINNHFSFTGVVVGLYTEQLENKLQVFEIEIEMNNLKTIVLPVLYGEFTKGKFKKGDKILVDGVVDLIEKKISCVASSIQNLTSYGRSKKIK